VTTSPSNGSDANPWIEKHRDAIIRGLSRLIQFPTVSGSEDPAEQRLFEVSVRGAQRWLVREADSLGMRTRSHGRRGLVIEAGQGRECIGVPLHLDVVPPGEGWRHPPFSGAVVDNQIWGRGAQDNKGPLMAMFHALAALVDSGRPFRRRVALLLGCGEEVMAWDDVEFLRDHEGAPTFSIVPDCRFPIVVGEKGYITVQLDAALTQSASSAVSLRSLASGDRPNIVPDAAEAMLDLSESAPSMDDVHSAAEAFDRAHADATIEITWPENSDRTCCVVTRGRRAHASSPQAGRNALVDLLAFLVEAFGDKLDHSTLSLLRHLHADSADVLGAGWGIKSEHDVMGATTACLSVMQIESGCVRALLNVRPVWGLSCDEVLTRMRARVAEWDGVSVKVAKPMRSFEPYLADTDAVAENLEALEAAWRSVTGTEPERLSMAGTTYAKVFPRSLGFGPCWSEQDEALFHQIDERTTIEAHLRNVRLYAQALSRLAQ
jgi:succinyl-diaminopimelate desuccinylase